MDKLFEETIEVVGKLNEEMMDQAEDGSSFGFVLLEMKTEGNMIFIEFCGIRIWYSEEDEREFIDDGKEEIYESLETYLRREINNMIEYIKKISL